MNKLLLALVITLISTQAQAGEYAIANARNKICTAWGDVGTYAYDERKKGMSLKKLLSYMPGDDEASQDVRTAALAGYDQTSSQDAYMTAWAQCMDKYER